MREKVVHELPKCSFCGEPAIYDAPQVDGQPWANFCEACKDRQKPYLAAGTKFKLVPKPESKERKILGTEASSIDEQVMGDREIECPTCQTLRLVEPDADYTFECEGCGVQVECPVPTC